MMAPLPIIPRGLSRELAAIYVGITADRFDQLVRAGRMPAPKDIGGTAVWNRYEIDTAFTAIAGDGAEQKTIGAPSQAPVAGQRRLLTATDIAHRWSCSPRHVRRLMQSGSLPAFRAGGKLFRCAEQAVEEFEKREAAEVRRIADEPKPPRLQRLNLNQLRPLRGPRKKPA